MEGQLLVRLITAVIRICERRAAQVGDMTQKVPLRILRYRIPDMKPDTPERDSRLKPGIALDRNAAHDGEAATVNYIVSDSVKLRTERGHVEIVSPYLENVLDFRLKLGDDSVEVSNICACQRMDPALIGGKIFSGPDCRIDNLFKRFSRFAQPRYVFEDFSICHGVILYP